jgi:hypothetical protein
MGVFVWSPLAFEAMVAEDRHLKRHLADQPVIFIMIADPVPSNGVAFQPAQCTVAPPNSRRIDRRLRIYSLEL